MPPLPPWSVLPMDAELPLKVVLVIESVPPLIIPPPSPGLMNPRKLKELTAELSANVEAETVNAP